MTEKQPLAQLTIVIHADHQMASFRQEIRKTLAGYLEAEDGDVKGRTQIILCLEQPDAEGSALCREILGTGEFYEIAGRDQLEAMIKGRYMVLLDQGDVLRMKDLSRMLQDLEEGDQGVYAVPADAPAKKKGQQPSAKMVWHPARADKYQVCLDPRGMTMRTSLIESASDLLGGEIRQAAALTKIILRNEGYAETGYRPFELNMDKINTRRYEITGDANQALEDLVSVIAKAGQAGEYAQAVLLELLLKQIKYHGPESVIREYIGQVSDRVLAAQEMRFYNKVYLFGLKAGDQLPEMLRVTDQKKLTVNGNELFSLDKLIFKVDICEIRDGKIIFQGRSSVHLLGEAYSFYIETEKKERIPIEMADFPPFDRPGPDGRIYRPKQFTAEVPVRSGLRISFVLEDSTKRQLTIWPRMGEFAKVVNNVGMSYFHTKDYIVQYKKGMFWVSKYSRGAHLKCERTYIRELIRRKLHFVIAYRMLYYLDRLLSRKPTWLVADRPHIAGDNGEHMFRFLQGTEAARRKNIYFVLREDSPDYARLKKIGKVLKYGSLRHKVKHLGAEVVMCAAFNDLMTNPLGKTGPFYRDLRRFSFVYLRHGVSHNDQSEFLNRYRLNIRILVSTSRPEYEGVLHGNYAYTEREVKLTGLPRFDNLYDERKKEIVILPTWRRQLQGVMEYRSSEREYVSRFKDSDYFLFYDALIHDERLLTAMEKFGYTGSFYLHPVFERQYPDFTASRRITIGKGVADYQTVFRESAIMVTDYSSVAFDFAYLKKPVIYSQFDEDTFYQNHSWGKGYFTYREDGFGPITNTVEQTVDELIYYMENGAKMKQEYVDKVDNFFAYTDRHNCERVYHAVLEDVERKNR